jgi:hypothetical protein
MTHEYVEEQILEILSNDPETAWLLAGMVVSEDGSNPSETEVRRALAGLAERGLVRAEGGAAPILAASSSRPRGGS